MATCKVCNDEFDRSCKLSADGEARFFDYVECAFYEVAPHCAGCDCRIVDYGIETGGLIFCCADCAHEYARGNPQDPFRSRKPASGVAGSRVFDLRVSNQGEHYGQM